MLNIFFSKISKSRESFNLIEVAKILLSFLLDIKIRFSNLFSLFNYIKVNFIKTNFLETKLKAKSFIGLSYLFLTCFICQDLFSYVKVNPSWKEPVNSDKQSECIITKPISKLAYNYSKYCLYGISGEPGNGSSSVCIWNSGYNYITPLAYPYMYVNPRTYDYLDEAEPSKNPLYDAPISHLALLQDMPIVVKKDEPNLYAIFTKDSSNRLREDGYSQLIAESILFPSETLRDAQGEEALKISAITSSAESIEETTFINNHILFAALPNKENNFNGDGSGIAIALLQDFKAELELEVKPKKSENKQKGPEADSQKQDNPEDKQKEPEADSKKQDNKENKATIKPEKFKALCSIMKWNLLDVNNGQNYGNRAIEFNKSLTAIKIDNEPEQVVNINDMWFDQRMQRLYVAIEAVGSKDANSGVWGVVVGQLKNREIKIDNSQNAKPNNSNASAANNTANSTANADKGLEENKNSQENSDKIADKVPQEASSKISSESVSDQNNNSNSLDKDLSAAQKSLEPKEQEQLSDLNIDNNSNNSKDPKDLAADKQKKNRASFLRRVLEFVKETLGIEKENAKDAAEIAKQEALKRAEEVQKISVFDKLVFYPIAPEIAAGNGFSGISCVGPSAHINVKRVKTLYTTTRLPYLITLSSSNTHNSEEGIYAYPLYQTIESAVPNKKGFVEFNATDLGTIASQAFAYFNVDPSSLEKYNTVPDSDINNISKPDANISESETNNAAQAGANIAEPNTNNDKADTNIAEPNANNGKVDADSSESETDNIRKSDVNSSKSDTNNAGKSGENSAEKAKAIAEQNRIAKLNLELLIKKRKMALENKQLVTENITSPNSCIARRFAKPLDKEQFIHKQYGDANYLSNRILKVGADSKLPGKIKHIETQLDTVFVSVDAANIEDSGIFFSQAIFDSEGVITDWSIWQRACALTNVSSFKYDPAFGIFWIADAQKPELARSTWENEIQNTQKTEVSKFVTKYFRKFGEPGIVSANDIKVGLDDSNSFMIFTGLSKIMLLQAEKSCSEINEQEYFNSTNGSLENLNSPVSAISISGGALESLGVIRASNLFKLGNINSIYNNYLLVAGSGGLAILCDDFGNGFQDTGKCFADLNSGLKFFKITDLKNILKIKYANNFIYALTREKLVRFAITPEDIVADSIRYETIFEQPDVLLTDAIVTPKLGLVSTDIGLFRTKSWSGLEKQADLISWQKIELPGAIGSDSGITPVNSLKAVTRTDREEDLINGGTIYALNSSVSRRQTLLYRLAVQKPKLTLSEDEQELEVDVIWDTFEKNRKSFYLSLGEYYSGFNCDGSLMLFSKCRANAVMPFVLALKHDYHGANRLRGLGGVPIWHYQLDNETNSQKDEGRPCYNVGPAIRSSSLGCWMIYGDFGLRLHY